MGSRSRSRRRIGELAAVLVGLLLLGLPPAPAAAEQGSAEMLTTHNALRAAIGEAPVDGDAALQAASQNHSNYLRLNHTGGHYETAGKPGYTGYVARDRARAAGFSGYPVSDVITNLVPGVNVLWHAPYHRLGMMHPQAFAAGWSGASPTVGTIAYDFGMDAPDVVRSPAAGQAGIPTTWPGDEYPAPQPPNAVGPFGYPIMVVYSHGRRVELRGAQLSGPGGVPLEFWVGEQHYEPDYALIVPKYPLPPASVIHVRMDLTVSGEDVTNEWDFKTVALPARARGAVVGPPIVVHARPGASVPVSLTYQNTGAYAWGQAPGDVRIYRGFAELALTTANVRFVCGTSCTWVNDLADGWPDAVTPARLTSVTPGATATATFRVKAPSAVGTYEIPVRLRGYEPAAAPMGEPGSLGASAFFLDDTPTTVVLVVDLGYHSAWAAQSGYPVLLPNETSPGLFVQFKNTGDLPWIRGAANQQANLGVVGDDLQWVQLGVGWPSGNRVAIQEEARVEPGGVGTFRFRVRAPPDAGVYRIWVRPVIDGVTWMDDAGVFLQITVAAPSFHSRWVTQSAYPTLAVGEVARTSLTFRNTGASPWVKGTSSEARLGINLDDRTFAQLGMGLGWPTPDRPAVQNEALVRPGETATFTFQVKGIRAGSYSLHLRPVIDGITWMEDEGIFVVVSVQ